VRRRIRDLVGNYGGCLKNSSQGLETFGGKGEEIMQGATSCIR